MTLRVSDNKRFLVEQDGRPFFYLGDTAWELFHRLNQEEAEFYLRTRTEQGFTVIQAVVLAEHQFDKPNANGHFPLENNDPTRPLEEYFAYVDMIVDKAAALGLTIGMLPTWGDKWNQKWGAGPEIFTPENAYTFGQYLGRRYKDKPIIWILGGDRSVENDSHYAIIREMARGLGDGDLNTHLRTFHPQGQQTSAQYFHDDPWLDFDMYQTGHSRDHSNYNLIAADYTRMPTKPCMDAEPGYEDHPNGFKAENGYLDDYDVRKSAYWALFAGAHGHTYGCHDIWQFYDPSGRFQQVTFAQTPWREAITFPGAQQMKHAKNLMLSRPFLTRVPDQSLIMDSPGEGTDHIQATRDSEGSYAFVYTASGQPFAIDLSKLSGELMRATWYDPRTGEAKAFGEYPGKTVQAFMPPTSGPGNDWVLVLDDTSCNFPAPGAVNGS